MARYTLDTRIGTYVIRGKTPALDERIVSVPAEIRLRCSSLL
jgi:hypothetical protein